MSVLRAADQRQSKSVMNSMAANTKVTPSGSQSEKEEIISANEHHFPHGEGMHTNSSLTPLLQQLNCQL